MSSPRVSVTAARTPATPAMQVRLQPTGHRKSTLSYASTVAILGVLTIVAGILFSSLFLTVNVWLPTVVVASVVAVAISIVSYWIALSGAESALAHIVGALLVLPGTVGVSNADFGLPLPKAMVSFAKVLIRGPVRLLTSPIPARNEAVNLVVPAVTVWLSVLIASLLARSSNPGWALLGPLFTFGVGLAFVPHSTPSRMIVACAFTALSFVYILVSSSNGRVEIEHGAIVSQLKRVAIIGAILGLAATLAPALTRTERFSLRDTRTPPFDPSELPSPLAEFRKYRQPKMLDTKLFSYTGGSSARWRLAVLPSYDGRVWSAGSIDDPNTGRFDLIGAQLRDPASYKRAEIRNTTITIDSLSEPWIASPGLPVDISMAANQRDEVRHNLETGSLVLNRNLPNKSTYSVSWVDVPQPTALQLSDAGFGASTPGLPSSSLVARLGTKATQFTKEGMSAWQQVNALKAALQNGYWNDRTPPGHALGDMVRMVASNEAMQGNDEHFASLFAVLARSRNVPVRVVVGFAPDLASPLPARTSLNSDGVTVTSFVREPNTIYGRDVRAWAEVNMGQYGWVPVDVIIDPTKRPKPKESRSVNEEDQKASPPNRVPLPESPQQQPVNAKKPDLTKPVPRHFEIPRILVITGISLLLPVLLFGAILLVIGAVKHRRRQQRRNRSSPAAAIGGAWEELLERAWEVGIRFPRYATIDEVGEAVSQARPDTNVRAIRDAVERAAFQLDPPSQQQRDQTWQNVDATVDKWHSALTKWQRFRIRVSLHSFRAVKGL
jgi:TgpA N-terminal domain/Transglutaminase-like superfamily